MKMVHRGVFLTAIIRFVLVVSIEFSFAFPQTTKDRTMLRATFSSILLRPKVLPSPRQPHRRLFSVPVEAGPDEREPCLVGVVGGIGPAASVRLQQLVVSKDSRRCQKKGFTRENGFLADSYHTPLLVFNNPQIPNNNRGALGLGPLPVDALTDTTLALSKAGAGAVAFACTTAYNWKDDVSRRSGVDIIDLLELVAQKVASDGLEQVGLLDVDGTHLSGRFRDCLERNGVKVVLPKENEQKTVMGVVADVKMGVNPADGPVDDLIKVVDQLIERHSIPGVILGCTEIAIALGSAESRPQIKYFDSLSLLADEIICRFHGENDE
uniref:Aspartate racemase n=2 Tax=Ditylum brightwellii TaxID=49249 RepID=A0A7S4QP64_9STRA|mmetsp:Transcript_2348/g.3131  ORF Transcript_2348/g.3131 Transcript_2348/m.3131 type:complete len:324 (+) Transcript_2348:53-1024(+)